MKNYLLSLCLLCSLTAFSQHRIKGTVIDTNNVPVEFTNIILYNTDNLDIPKGKITDKNGAYTFENLKESTYYLEISLLGFKTQKTDVFKLTSDKEFNITLEEESQTLNEVIVKSKRPVIRQTAEKLVVDLEKSELLNNNLQDVIKRVPGVIVSNNSISFAGRSDVRILINGKTTDYMDINALLRDLPSDNIARVELIEQPGAEFEAEGSGPIINIILKKNVRLGTHGNVSTWIGEDEGIEYGFNTSIASYKNKLNWQLNAGYSSPTWRDDLFIDRTVNDPNLNETVIYDQASISPFNPKRISAGGRIDYYINDKHSIGFGTRFNNTMSDRTSNSELKIISSIETNIIATENVFNRERSIFSINPYYEYKTDKDKLTLDYNHINYANNNVDDIIETQESTLSFVDQRYLQDGKYTINTYKLDYNHVFSDNFKFYFGSKYADVNTDSDLQTFGETSNGQLEFQVDNSNRFTIDEDIFALYSKVNSKFGQWSFSGGLRYENSNTKGFSTQTNNTRERKISKVFPSASISRKLTKNLGTSLAYSYRIRRPNYNSLNSFITTYAPLSSERGNPTLKPAFTNNYQFNLTFDGQPFFTVGYSDTKDDLFLFITQDDATAESARTTINLKERQNWNFRLFGPLEFIKKVDGFTGFIVNYNMFYSDGKTLTENLNETYPTMNITKWNLAWYTQANYDLPWNVNFELSCYLSTGELQGQIDSGWVGDLNCSFGKKLMNDRLKVNLGFNKILNRGFVGTVNYNNVNANIEANGSRQNIQLRLNYSFGDKFGKKTSKRNTSQEEEDRINDND